jgi:NitT/TauT family transport system permease protein
MNQSTVTGDRARRLPPWGGPWVRGAAGVVVFLLLAEAAGRLGIISRSALPLTSSVLARVVLLAGNTRFLADFGATVEAWAVGMAITVAAGVPLGVLHGSLPGVRAATRAIVEFLRPIPSVALILLVSLLLGPGLRMSVTLIVYGAIWPVLYNTIDGAATVDPQHLETGRAFRLSVWQRLVWVIIPAALPKAFAGFRLSLSLSLILMVFAELVGSSNGIGYEMSRVELVRHDIPVVDDRAARHPRLPAQRAARRGGATCTFLAHGQGAGLTCSR